MLILSGSFVQNSHSFFNMLDQAVSSNILVTMKSPVAGHSGLPREVSATVLLGTESY
jgi:hypothetical protein